MKYLTCFLTEKCSNRCSYCDIGKMKNRKSPDKNIIDKYIPIINSSPWERVNLTGGEIGTLDPNILRFLFEELGSKKIKINTNGLFLKRYSNEYLHLIERIHLHPVSEIDQSFQETYKDVFYTFPLHHNNIIYLDGFLSAHRKFLIHFLFYNEKYENGTYHLTPKDIQNIITIFHKHDNISLQSRNHAALIQKYMNSKEIKKIRRFCFEKIHYNPSIDFVNGEIKKCICSHSRAARAPLTVSNFNGLWDNTLKFNDTSLCSNCYHPIIYLEDMKHEFFRTRSSPA